MNTLKFFIKIFLIGLVIALFTNSAFVLFCGVIFAIIWQCISDARQMKNKVGQEQIIKEIKKEKEIEEYWGIIK